MTIPGIVTAAALTALAPPAETFQRGRDFAAWLGLTPIQQSSGGKERLGRTSKMGERTLRRLLIIGASAVAGWASRKGVPADSWLGRMLARKPPMLVRVALANKMARVVWALLAKGGRLASSGRGGVVVATAARRSEGRTGGMARRSRDGGRDSQMMDERSQAREVEAAPIRRLPYGPAACDEPHQRPDTCQHPTARRTEPDDSSCLGGGVHTCPSRARHRA